MEQLFNTHYAQWRFNAIRLERDTTRGEDLLSETLLKILEKHRKQAEEVASRGKLYEYVNRSIYLMKIGKHTKYHKLYKRYAAQWSTETNVANLEPETPWLGARLNNEYVDAYISMMPELDAVILRLYAMKDFNYATVSKETGIPTKTLYKLVENAITKIRNNVQAQRPSESSHVAHD